MWRFLQYLDHAVFYFDKIFVGLVSLVVAVSPYLLVCSVGWHLIDLLEMPVWRADLAKGSSLGFTFMIVEWLLWVGINRSK